MRKAVACLIRSELLSCRLLTTTRADINARDAERIEKEAKLTCSLGSGSFAYSIFCSGSPAFGHGQKADERGSSQRRAQRSGT
jgi:hypothetical protein